MQVCFSNLCKPDYLIYFVIGTGYFVIKRENMALSRYPHFIPLSFKTVLIFLLEIITI